MALILRAVAFLCLVYCTVSAPVQTALASKSRRATSESQDPSPRQKVILLQKKLADLQKNLQLLEGTFDGASRTPPELQGGDDIAEILEQAVGIHLGKYDEYGNDDDDDPFGGIIEGGDRASQIKFDEEVIDEEKRVDTGRPMENSGAQGTAHAFLTSDEKELLRRLKEKQAGRSRDDVLRQFLEERVGNQGDGKMSQNNDVESNSQQRQDLELAAEISDLEKNKNGEGVILVNAPPAHPDGYFVEHPFTESELGPLKPQLEEVEEKLLSDLKLALDHGVTLSDLLNDISDKEKHSLQREAFVLAEQLGNTEREIEKLQLNAE